MDSSDSQIDSNPIENSDAPSNETKDENTTAETSETSEQSNVIDVIGNGQLVKKVSPIFRSSRSCSKQRQTESCI